MWKKRGKKLAQKRKKIGIAAAAVIVAAAGSTLIYHNLPQTKVEKQLTLAAKYMTEMNYLEAQEAYTEALSIDEGSVRAYRGLADDYAAQGYFVSSYILAALDGLKFRHPCEPFTL